MTNILAIDVRDYGAVPDAIHLTSGSASGTGASCPTAHFVSGDVGKHIKITSGFTNTGIFRGTISSVTNSTTIVLSGSCTGSASGTANIYYGTDNAASLQAAFDAATAIPITSDVKIKVCGPANATGGGYMFCTALTSDNLDLDFEAPLYSNIGLGTGDTATAWVLGNSDITNIRMDVSGGSGLEWGNTGGHTLNLDALEVSNVGFNGQFALTGHGFGFNIRGYAACQAGTIGFNFNDCQDIHGQGVLNAVGCAFALGLNGSEDFQINLVADTVGNAAFLIDAAHNGVLNCNAFVNGTNTAATGKIGSVSTTNSSGLVINLLAQASGGPALYVDYCNGGVEVNITATNRPLNSGVHNDLTYAVQYGSHISGTLNIKVTRDAAIPLYTGTQYGNLTDNCGGSTKVYGLTGTLSQLDFSSGLTTVADGLTRYLGQGCVSATESDVQFSVTFPFTIVGLYANTVTSPTGTSFYTVRKNGADTAVTAYIGGVVNANPKTSDTAHSVSFVAGDLISLKLVTNGGVPTRNHRCSIVASM